MGWENSLAQRAGYPLDVLGKAAYYDEDRRQREADKSRWGLKLETGGTQRTGRCRKRKAEWDVKSWSDQRIESDKRAQLSAKRIAKSASTGQNEGARGRICIHSWGTVDSHRDCPVKASWSPALPFHEVWGAQPAESDAARAIDPTAAGQRPVNRRLNGQKFQALAKVAPRCDWEPKSCHSQSWSSLGSIHLAVEAIIAATRVATIATAISLR